jgi:plasmid maintenance system antidote protein VapI
MNTPNTEKRRIKPAHPGEMLREDFLPNSIFPRRK